MDDVWEQRRKKLEAALRVAVLELMAHSGGAAAMQCELGNGFKVRVENTGGEDEAAGELDHPIIVGADPDTGHGPVIAPETPSRFQMFDQVRAYGTVKGTVCAITFLLVDGMGKVAYDIAAGGRVLYRVLSDDVGPAQPEHLHVVPDSKG